LLLRRDNCVARSESMQSSILDTNVANAGLLNDPHIQLFIPVRNGANYIRECIESIVVQSYRNWSLTVSDNQSTDSTEEIVAGFLTDSRITWSRQATNVGLIGNFNSCIDRATSDFYAVLAHDDKYYAADALEKSVAILQSDSTLCAVYSNVLWIDGKSKPIIELKLPKAGKLQSDFIALRSIVNCRNQFGVPLLNRRVDVGECRYGAQFPHAADIDFSIAVGAKKYIYVLNEPKVAIRFHGSNNTMRDFSRLRPEILAIAKNRGLPLSAAQRAQMYVNDHLTRLKKRLFFMYLDYFR
jgi:glycosyltransferase involved in cell wall biosynthesis